MTVNFSPFMGLFGSGRVQSERFALFDLHVFESFGNGVMKIFSGTRKDRLKLGWKV